MQHAFDLDWAAMFRLSMPWTELVIRGTAIYWFLFLVFRFVIRRDVGAVGIADILLLVILADASQNAMAGEYKSITDGCILLSVLIGWNVLLDWLSFRYVAFRRFAQPAPLCLVRNGQLMKQNMRREFVTEEELWTALRKEGVDSLAQVKAVYLESDGAFSVIKSD